MKAITLFLIILGTLLIISCSKPVNVQMKEKEEQLRLDVQPSSRCNNIQDENKKNECYNELEREGIAVCELITSSFDKDICLDNVAIKIAKIKKDISRCDTIKQQLEKSRCYSIVGVEKQDLSICDSIKDPTFLSYKVDCYHKIAVKQGDVSICRKIDDDKYESLCNNEVAKARRDISICNNLQKDKDVCYLEVGIEKEDISRCNSIKISVLRFSCFVSIAQKKQDPLICSNIADAYGRYSCYTQVAKEKKDESVCNLIQNQDFKEECIFQTNKQKGNVEICDKIKVEIGNIDDEYKKDFCYIDIAALSKDPGLCEKVSDESNRGSCYGMLANIAIDDGNVKLCGMIKDEELKDYCYRDVVLEMK